MAALGTDYDVVLADARLIARMAAVRADWRQLKLSGRQSLAAPGVIVGAAVAAAMWGARSPAPRESATCKCAKPEGGFSRAILAAMAGPLLKRAVERAVELFRDDREAPASMESDTQARTSYSAFSRS